MRLFSKQFAVLAILAGAALVVSSSSAHATFTLTLQSGGVTQTFGDGGTGHIVVGTTIGAFTFQGDVGNSDSSGRSDPAILSLAETSITSASGGTLTITLTDNGFVAPAGPVNVTTALTTLLLTSGGSVSEATLVNGTQVGSTLMLSSLATATGGGTATVGTPFTLSNVTTITLGAGGMVLSTGASTVSGAAVVPEPATLAMVFSVLPLLGLGAWRNRRKSV